MAVLLISGASSGIGLATARHFVTKGWQVFGLSRHPLADEPNFRQLTCDVTEPEAVREAVAAVLRETGRIDLLIANAGFGISGPVESCGEAEAHRQFEVNFFGAWRLVQAVLPSMRATGGGRVVLVSSFAALTPIPFQAFYSASKAALASLARALDMELRPFKIRVSALLPGDIRTGFTGARVKPELSADDPYAVRCARSLERMERDETGGAGAESIAVILERMARSRRPRSLVVPGLSYRLAAVLVKFLPLRLADWLLFRLYAS